MSVNGKAATQVVTGELHRVRRGHGRRFSAEPPPEPSRRPNSRRSHAGPDAHDPEGDRPR